MRVLSFKPRPWVVETETSVLLLRPADVDEKASRAGTSARYIINARSSMWNTAVFWGAGAELPCRCRRRARRRRGEIGAMPKKWRGTATAPTEDRRRAPSGAAPTTTRRARTTPWTAQAGLPRRSRSARARQSGLKWHDDRAFRLVILHEFLGTVPFGCYQEGGQLRMWRRGGV